MNQVRARSSLGRAVLLTLGLSLPFFSTLLAFTLSSSSTRIVSTQRIQQDRQKVNKRGVYVSPRRELDFAGCSPASSLPSLNFRSFIYRRE